MGAKKKASERKAFEPKAASAAKRKSAVVEAPADIAERAELQPAPKPKNCRKFTKRQLAKAWPEIVGGCVSRAKKGSLNDVKFMVDFSGLKDAARKAQRDKKPFSLADMLRGELDQTDDASKKVEVGGS